MSSPAHRANSDANPSDKTRNAHSDSELVQRLVLVNALQVEASMCLDPEGILAQAHLPAVFADRSVWIGLVSADGKELTPSVLAGKELDPDFRIDLASGTSALATVVAGGRLSLPNLCDGVAPDLDVLHGLGFGWIVAVPIWADDRVVATLSLCAQSAEQCSADEVLLLGQVAGFLGAALKHAELFEELQQAGQALRSSEGEVHRLAQVASLTTNMAAILDESGRIEWTNEAFTEITGFEAGEAQGCLLADLVGDWDNMSDELIEARALWGAGSGARVEVRNYTKDRVEFWWDIEL